MRDPCSFHLVDTLAPLVDASSLLPRPPTSLISLELGSLGKLPKAEEFRLDGALGPESLVLNKGFPRVEKSVELLSVGVEQEYKSRVVLGAGMARLSGTGRKVRCGSKGRPGPALTVSISFSRIGASAAEQVKISAELLRCE